MANGKKKLSEFERRFAEARKLGLESFDFQGNKYHTSTKEEIARNKEQLAFTEANARVPKPQLVHNQKTVKDGTWETYSTQENIGDHQSIRYGVGVSNIDGSRSDTLQYSFNPVDVPDVHKEYSTQNTHIQHTDAEGNVTKENYQTHDPKFNESATLTKHVKRGLGEYSNFPTADEMDKVVKRPSNDGFNFKTVNEKRSGYKAGE